MPTIEASAAWANFFELLAQAAESHEPVLITSAKGNAVLVGEDDWKSMQETLYLLGVPGMRESIRKGLKTPLNRCSSNPGW